jgi:hypothetical protein
MSPSIGLAVLDDGCGMNARTLRSALQFGGSERFGDRTGPGRFGFGLPNSSISQSRRVEVFSWIDYRRPFHSYLDVDEIASGRLKEIPNPTRARLPDWVKGPIGPSGTLIHWRTCDRLTHKTVRGLTKALHEGLGRTYRHFLWAGVQIQINGQDVSAIDPLLERGCELQPSASQYGEEQRLELKVPANPSRTAIVTVRFSALPVRAWKNLALETKRTAGIVGGAGVYIVRAGREIDQGWFFMGSKRRENYDDWWRCEIRFEPSLDEYFRVTNSKQGITPHPRLVEILSSHLEPIARELNSRVRHEFRDSPQKNTARHSQASRVAGATEVATRVERFLPNSKPSTKSPRTLRRTTIGAKYEIRFKKGRGGAFYDVKVRSRTTVLILNTNHPFFEQVYLPCCASSETEKFALESLLLAAARAELTTIRQTSLADGLRLFREEWSDALFAYLTRR